MRLAVTAALLMAAVMPAAEGGKPRIPRSLLAPLESSFDVRISKPGQAVPFDLLGNTRAVYLEGFGVVLSSEVNLVVTSVSPFRPSITKEDAANIHRKKLAQLEVLKKAMRDLMISSAASLTSLPPGEQVAVAVTLFSYSWEQRAGLPSQILMQAPKAALLKSAGQGLESALKVEEF
jgi:hypothetical protein